MMTHSTGPLGPTLYTSGMSSEVAAEQRIAPSRRSSTGTSPLEGLSQKAGRTPQRDRTEQIVELVVAAVTVVADLVTAALSRAGREEGGARPAPQSNPGARPPMPWGGTPRPVDAPSQTPVSGATPSQRLEAIRSDTGAITVRTFDGYQVRVEGSKGEWSITSPDGKTSRMTGGSQVRESDGGRWSFSGRSSFLFGPHKITVRSSSGKEGASEMTIYSGRERVTIGGLSTDRPTLDAIAGDGFSHDDSVNDGAIYLRSQTKFGESWSSVSGGSRRVMGAR